MSTVLFDFDCTLTKADTSRPFAHFISRRHGKVGQLFQLYYLLVQLRLGLIADRQFKENYLALFFKGRDEDAVDDDAVAFMESRLPSMLRGELVQKLKEHVGRGDQVYLVSANFDFFLKPLKTQWGLSGIIATDTERVGGRFTGKIVGEACKGANKIGRVEAVIGRDALSRAVAYGDAEDRALLDQVKEGFEVA